MSQPVRVVATRTAFRGKVLHLEVERVELPNGETCDLEIIRHPGAAAVLPVDADGQVVLVRQIRHATGGWILEVPAGKLDDGEAPEVCAQRELEEETGLRAGSLKPLGWIWTTPGFTDEKIWLYLATDLEFGCQQLESDEVLSIEKMPLREAVDQALDGQIQDGKTVCALLRAAAQLPTLLSGEKSVDVGVAELRPTAPSES